MDWRLAALPLALTVLSTAFVFATQCVVSERGRLESAEERGSLRDAVVEDARANAGSSVEVAMDGLMTGLGPVMSGHVRASSLGGFLDDLHAWQKDAVRMGDGP